MAWPVVGEERKLWLGLDWALVTAGMFTSSSWKAVTSRASAERGGARLSLQPATELVVHRGGGLEPMANIVDHGCFARARQQDRGACCV